MSKKKKEHVTFDLVCKVRPSLPFAKTNRLSASKKSRGEKTEAMIPKGERTHNGD